MLTIYASPPPPSPTTTTDTTTSGMGSSGSIKDVDEKTPGTVYGYEKAKLLQKICLENKRMYAELHGLHLIVGTPSSLVEAFAPRLLKIRWILQLLNEGYDRVFYIDLDTLILDASVDITVDINSMRTPLAISMDFNQYRTRGGIGGRKHQKRGITHMLIHIHIHACTHTYIYTYTHEIDKDHARDILDMKRFNTGVMILQNNELLKVSMHMQMYTRMQKYMCS